MKKLITVLLFVLPIYSYAVDVKLSALPLGGASSVGVNDSFPYVNAFLGMTQRLKLSDLPNVPQIAAAISGSVTNLNRGEIAGATAYQMVLNGGDGRMTDGLSPGTSGKVAQSDGQKWTSSLITDSNVSSSAAIYRGKLLGATAYQMLLNDNQGYPTDGLSPGTSGYVAQSDGQKWISSQISNSSISSSAAIGRSKIAGATAYQMVTNDQSGRPTDGLSPGTAGNVSLSDGQKWTSSQISNTSVSSSAAVGRTKLAGATAYQMLLNDNQGYPSDGLSPGTIGKVAQSDGQKWTSSLLTDTNVSSSAALGRAKIAGATAYQLLINDQSGRPTDGLSPGTSGKVAQSDGQSWTSGLITDSNVSSSAAITRSKIIGATAYQMVTNDQNGRPTDGLSPGTSGNVSLSDGQKWTSSQISNTSVATSAAIGRAKLAGATAYQMLLNDNTGYPTDGLSPGANGNVAQSDGQKFTSAQITNSNVSGSAAIARAKLAGGTAYQVVIQDNNGYPTDGVPLGTKGQILTSNGPTSPATFQTSSSATVTSGAAIRIEYARVNGTCTSSPCTIDSQTGGFTQITRASTGNYTASLTVNGSGSFGACFVYGSTPQVQTTGGFNNSTCQFVTSSDIGTNTDASFVVMMIVLQ